MIAKVARIHLKEFTDFDLVEDAQDHAPRRCLASGRSLDIRDRQEVVIAEDRGDEDDPAAVGGQVQPHLVVFEEVIGRIVATDVQELGPVPDREGIDVVPPRKSRFWMLSLLCM